VDEVDNNEEASVFTTERYHCTCSKVHSIRRHTESPLFKKIFSQTENSLFQSRRMRHYQSATARLKHTRHNMKLLNMVCTGSVYVQISV